MKNYIYKIILGVAVLIFIILFSYLSIKRYKTLNSYYYDLGIMNQVVYNTSHGRFLEMSNQELKKNVSRLAIHFDPILAAFAPFYKLYEGPEVLLIGQAIILGLGALVVFLISQKVLKKNLISFIFALLYLFYFPIQRAVLFDFHAVTLATTFFLFAIYFQEVKKWSWFFFFIFLSLLTKEHIGLVVFFFGVYLLIIKKERKIGLTTSILGLSFFILTVYFIIPYFRGGAHFASGYFVDIESRFPTILKDGVDYIKLLMPPLFYALFSPLTLLISLPEWAINIFSISSSMRSILFHYNSVIVAFIFYSLILGYKNFTKLIKNNVIQNIFFVIFICLNIRSIYSYNPVPGFVKHPVNYQNLDQITEKSIKTWQEKLKNENIKVSTTPKLAPLFTNRRYYHNFLYDSAYLSVGLSNDDIISTIGSYKIADFVIIYRPEIGNLNKDSLPVKFYKKLKEDSKYKMIFSDDRNEKSIEVYQKI